MIHFLDNFRRLIIQAHWEILQAHFNFNEPFAYFYFFQGGSPPRVEFALLCFKQKRHCTQLQSVLLR